METIFKVGDRVYDPVHYHGEEGEVTGVNAGPDYPVQVWFGDKGEDIYTLDGRAYYSHAPTLSLVPYEFKRPEQPTTFEKYERVLVADDLLGPWMPGVFIEHLPAQRFPYRCGTASWHYCRKWDESLIGKVTR